MLCCHYLNFLLWKKTSSTCTEAYSPRMVLNPMFSMLFFSHLIRSFSQKLFLSAMRWNRTIPLISIFTEAWPYARLSCNIVCIHYIVHVKYMKKMRCIFKMLYKFSLLMWAHLSLLCPVVSIYQYFAVKVPWKCWYVILQYTVIHNTQFEFH